MIKCKFKVISKTQLETTYNCGCAKPSIVELSPVQGEPFGKYTPSGNIKMLIQNDEVEKQFQVSKEYFVDFTPVE